MLSLEEKRFENIADVIRQNIYWKKNMLSLEEKRFENIADVIPYFATKKYDR